MKTHLRKRARRSRTFLRERCQKQTSFHYHPKTSNNEKKACSEQVPAEPNRTILLIAIIIWMSAAVVEHTFMKSDLLLQLVGPWVGIMVGYHFGSSKQNRQVADV